MSPATGKPPPAPPAQLIFDLSCRSALGAEDFLVSPSNEEAVRMMDRWPDWQHWAVIVCGPPRAGKSHLANVWRMKSGAIDLPSASLTIDRVSVAAASKTIVVEDIDRGIGDEQALFHLLNLAREHSLSILLTSSIAPGDIDIALPDLRSRLCALPLVNILEPDESLLHGVLVKHFNDRQLIVEPQVINYLALYMERSMRGAAEVVAEIDKKALATKRKVSQRLASEVLVALSARHETKRARTKGAA